MKVELASMKIVISNLHFLPSFSIYYVFELKKQLRNFKNIFLLTN